MNAPSPILQKNIFDRISDNYCVKCGAKLPTYPYYDDKGNQFVVCTKCGEKTILKEEKIIIGGF